MSDSCRSRKNFHDKTVDLWYSQVMKKFTSPKILAVVLVGAFSVAGLAVAPASVQALPAGSSKVTICHRTHSVTNPYRRITVSQSSIVGGANSKHGNYSGEHNDWSVGKFGNSRPASTIANVFDPNHTYSPASDKKWGDIVPNVDVSGNAIQGGFTGLNYINEGLAIYNGSTYNGVNYAGLCKSMSTKQYVQSEITSGRTPQEVVDELNDMDANEDKTTLQQLGGNSFTTLSIQQVSSTGAVTNQPTAVQGTTATLNGEYLIGSKTATSTRFIFGTDATCATGTTVSATPTSATTGTPVSFNATGLSAGTTYYYKVVGTVDAGTDDEAIVEGDCVQFVVAQGGSSSGGSTSGGGTSVVNLPATGMSLNIEALATLMTTVGLALVTVRRRRVI